MTQHQFSIEQIQLLHHFFPIEIGHEDQYGFARLQGYLCAISAAPDYPAFELWWQILREHPSIKIDAKAEQQLLPLILTLKDKVVESLQNDHPPIPDPTPLGDIADGMSATEQWCRGFMEGLMLSKEAWFAVGSEDEHKSLELTFGSIALLASRKRMRDKIKRNDFDQ